LLEQIQDLRMVLSAVDVPADRSARHAALKTLFFGLSDEDIVPLYGDDLSAGSARTREALALLARLSARRERASLPGETVLDPFATVLAEDERLIRHHAQLGGNRARLLCHLNQLVGRLGEFVVLVIVKVYKWLLV
jgi:hypothetical protein